MCMHFCFQVTVLVKEKLGRGNLELFLVGRCIKWFSGFLWVKKIEGEYLFKETECGKYCIMSYFSAGVGTW